LKQHTAFVKSVTTASLYADIQTGDIQYTR